MALSAGNGPTIISDLSGRSQESIILRIVLICYNGLVLMLKKDFATHTKVNESLFYFLDKKMIKWAVPRLPKFLNGYNLTLFTILWSFLMIVFGYLAQFDINWLWALSLIIVLHWFTDTVDGSVGVYRKTGLIRWGYYMDHFLDFVFLCCFLIAYSFIIPDDLKYLLFFALAIYGSYMVNSFLQFAVTNEFRISYFRIGPTEIRIVMIIINTLVAIFGKVHVRTALPYVVVLSILGLCLVVYNTQKLIYKLDEKHKGSKIRL
ncbi:hypothetical protein A3B50_03360 [Candidatus Roizmanbacteria bacterium RIFCSPLOWO2_01_FULL_40_42]|uniref:CDP-alcohol phosphatidyltransferase n=1 Tax=Candidatus Roizmanbacteria bacterium RIFCSPLOWO2_01_FULL_40_42 TaxID=1802066 RepID=A0A1F7J6H9_9BACT|nr:MAG: hypothetical protein A2W49_04605 [Candidatus Roizmanbacteria bacterium RIFCSPHIGHO2_12_41_18]OGK51230.1 MAG: hypothetical protein A3B50_03360 [Candidatus Roizmanbacteria bacterium RIFCSPLOWO2_01_FULL_40_42]